MQSVKKFNITEYINLYYIHDEKYKTVSMTMYLHRRLNRGEVTKNALLAKVLARGTAKHNNIKAINTHLEELYGTLYGLDVIKKANVQSLCCTVSNISGRFTKDDVTYKAAKLMTEFVFEPYVTDGAFCEAYVQTEKQNLRDDISAIVNDKRSYANLRLIEEMCRGEENAVLECGYIEDIDSIDSKNLYEHYRKIVFSSPIDIFVVGDVDINKLVASFAEYFSKHNFDIKPFEIRGSQKNASEVKYVDEVMEINQGKLSMGLRTGIADGDEEYYALLVGNSIFGAGAHSKLFNNVREKMSLCYYASSRLDKFNSLMVVSSGIEFANFAKAKDEIMIQLDAVKKGDFTEDELKIAKEFIINSYTSYLDSPYLMRRFYLAMSFSKNKDTIDEAVQKVAAVTKEQVESAFANVSLDTVYFLKGEEADR